MTILRNKKFTIPIIILIVLIAIRISLPFVVTKFVNKTLSQLEGFTGSISDVDLFLLAGSYTICDLTLEKRVGNINEPYLKIPRSVLSVQWKALFDGAIVGEVELTRPELNFIFGATEETSQTGAEEDWVKLVEDLMPIRINRFAGTDAIFNFKYTASEPNYAADFKEFEFDIGNIRNVVDTSDPLPSTIVASGKSPTYSGDMKLEARAFFLKEIPDINYNFSFENIQLTSLNPLAQYFAGMDFEEGTLDMYSELSLVDSEIKGYFKPLLHDAKIFKWKEEDRKLGQGIKEFFAEGVQELFENQKLEQTGTKIPLEGNIEGAETNIWVTIATAFKNAYVSALNGQIDNTISYKEGLAKANASDNDSADESENDDSKKEKKGFFKRLFSSDDKDKDSTDNEKNSKNDNKQ